MNPEKSSSPEPSERRGHASSLNLERLSTDDILALNEALHAFMNNDRGSATYAVDGLFDTFGRAVESLPGQNLDKGREVFRALASSKDKDNRGMAASYIDRLLQAEDEANPGRGTHAKEAAINLWLGLASDDVEVSHVAGQAVAEAIREGRIRPTFAAWMLEVVAQTHMSSEPAPVEAPSERPAAGD
jgi:hypothetical protein